MSASGVPEGRSPVVIFIGAVGLGLLTALRADLGVVLLGALVFIGIYLALPRDRFPVAVAVILFTVPMDHLDALSDLRLPLIGSIAILGVAFGLVFGGRSLSEFVVDSWDVLAFAAVVVFVVLFHGVTGGLRQAGTLLAGVLFYVWMRASHKASCGQMAFFVKMMFCVGAAQGAFAVIGRIVGSEALASLIPTYFPAVKDLGYALGNRAVAFAGHPLRLGTICMSAAIAGSGLLATYGGRRRVLVLVGLGVSLTGLVLSGARGAWLGTVAGVMTALIVAPRHEASKVGIRVAVGGLAGYVLLNAVGAVRFLEERLFGVAFQAESIGQRLGVLGASVAIISGSPLTGYGFGAYLQEVFAQGFRYANTENQYVDFLLAGGLPLLIAFALVVGRGLLHSLRLKDVPFGPTAAGLVVAWSVNAATYNLYAWSAAFPVFMILMALVADSDE